MIKFSAEEVNAGSAFEEVVESSARGGALKRSQRDQRWCASLRRSSPFVCYAFDLTAALLSGGHCGQLAPWGESASFRWLTHRLPCFGCNWQCHYERPFCLHDIPPGEVARNLVQLLT